jgi:hypothetical protein
MKYLIPSLLLLILAGCTSGGVSYDYPGAYYDTHFRYDVTGYHVDRSPPPKRKPPRRKPSRPPRTMR